MKGDKDLNPLIAINPCTAHIFCTTFAPPSASNVGQGDAVDDSLPCSTVSMSSQVSVHTENLPLLATAMRLARSTGTASLWNCQPSRNTAIGISSVVSSGQNTKSGLL